MTSRKPADISPHPAASRMVLSASPSWRWKYFTFGLALPAITVFLNLNEFVQVVPSLLQIIDATFVTPAADVLHHVAIQIADLIGNNVVPRLDGALAL